MGRHFSGAATELALAGYPGLHLTAPPTAGSVYGVYWPALVPADLVVPEVVHADGRRVEVPAPANQPEGGGAHRWRTRLTPRWRPEPSRKRRWRPSPRSTRRT